MCGESGSAIIERVRNSIFEESLGTDIENLPFHSAPMNIECFGEGL